MTIGKVHGTGGGNYDVDLAAHAHGEAETEHLYGGADAPKAETGKLSAAQLRANLAIYGGRYNSGDTSPVSGQFVTIDSHGKKVGAEQTIEKGKPFPPTPGKDMHFKLLDPSRGIAGNAATDGGSTFGMPGTKAEKSGQYVLVDPKGKQVGSNETTVAKGAKFPPTPKAGQMWKLADETSLSRSGEKAEISGQYALVGADGKFAGEITMTKGDKFPPTPAGGQGFRLIDATKGDGAQFNGPTFLPGQKVGTSGQYELITPQGKKTGQEVTLTKGKSFPPTPESGELYRLKDATKHK